ncbi:hypothetical protein GCK32_001577 [Trichostrongylus colubriformis]|uniref:Uncharacterized protein n=1 Tax=Trichostrongylus colubriformis TaxID=6319 RepID=A0AAN8J1V5_TRICO
MPRYMWMERPHCENLRKISTTVMDVICGGWAAFEITRAPIQVPNAPRKMKYKGDQGGGDDSVVSPDPNSVGNYTINEAGYFTSRAEHIRDKRFVKAKRRLFN